MSLRTRKLSRFLSDKSFQGEKFWLWMISDDPLPIVDAWWLLVSVLLCIDSLLSELRVPHVEPIRFKLFARLTIVATVLQYNALANESLANDACELWWKEIK